MEGLEVLESLQDVNMTGSELEILQEIKDIIITDVEILQSIQSMVPRILEVLLFIGGIGIGIAIAWGLLKWME